LHDAYAAGGRGLKGHDTTQTLFEAAWARYGLDPTRSTRESGLV